jgi:hypothetical protein
MGMNDASHYRPQYIEDSPFVVLEVPEYERLLQWYDPETVFRLPPQFLKDGDGTQTHVVLIADEFNASLANLPNSAFIFSIDMPHKAVQAWGMLHWPDKAMTVFRGSLVGDVVPSLQPAHKTLRQKLIDDKIIGVNRCQLMFLRNHTFDDPSTAARIVTGVSASGNAWWKNGDGKSLKELGYGTE